MIRRILAGIVVLAILWFAIEGGQWGSYDLWSQRRQKIRLQHEIDSLAKRVDSLRKYRARLDTDRELQEKLARENVGMVRGDKELLYLISPVDTTAGRVRKP
ncbi:MAG TPA: septum formation initiator family protein [Gemmatimonadaceae bacterium]|nr:septum formation initiator family protein [Gemmatimonadaceae bacterium]